jgi:hypothetical protein
LLPLYANLAAGHIWRWFAINIPMDLGTGGGEFTSDIDILARLYNYPTSKEWFYETWEVKVGLLCKDGGGRSLKSGKLARTKNQLAAYRNFGSPCVSLLDIYICEAGFMTKNPFPPPFLYRTIKPKMMELSQDGFGYQMLPFEHDKDGDVDVGLKAYSISKNPLETKFNIVPAGRSHPREPFSRLADRINDFFEHVSDNPNKAFKQIVFCRNCRDLQFISMKETHTCPNCKSDLIIQS